AERELLVRVPASGARGPWGPREQACRGVRRGEAPRFNNEALPRRHRRRGRVQNPGQSERAQRVSHASRLSRQAATAAKAERELLVRVPANGAERAAKSERSAVNPGQSERAQRVSHASGAGPMGPPRASV